MLDRRSAMLAGAKKSRLPVEYQEVEYISSENGRVGDQGTKNTTPYCIDTNYIPKWNSQLELVFQKTAQQSEVSETAWGVYAKTRNNIRCDFWAHIRAAPSQLGFSLVDDANFTFNNTNDLNKHTAFLNLYTSTAYIDDLQTSAIITKTIDFQFPIYLFCRNEPDAASNATVKYPSRIKIYSFKAYENELIVRDFVPCYRKSDGEAGLYELCENLFYPNDGTGEFVIGDEI